MTRLLAAALTLSVVIACGAASAQPAGGSEPAGPAVSPGDQKAADQSLAVSQVKLTSGRRVSKLIGASVYNETDEKVGSVDDLILSADDKATLVVVQVGGFLGVGGKLVAMPFDKLQVGQDGKVQLAGATKNALAAQPAFTY